MNKKLIVALVILLGLFIRLPYVFQNLPFFYEEDEAHHFNRLTRMVKTGDLNPHYFHKPSLHFYLRLPVYGISFLNDVRKGKIREVGEINTKDDAGVGGYAFSASHPDLVVGQRLFSLLLSMATIGLTMLLTFRLSGASRTAMSVAGLVIALSPMDVRLSSFIGVDVVMTFFCVLSTWWSYRAITERKFSFVLLASLAAGAAVSSKYNALPIAFVPLFAAFVVSKFDPLKIFASGALVGITFLACSPFIIVSIPEFLNQFGYEVWHYGVEGHEGHTASPGLGQLLFYSRWLITDGVGLLATFAALLGLGVAIKKKSAGIVVIVFPILFFLLMISQKVNFERNMLVLLPYVACLAGIFFKKNTRTALAAVICLIIVAQPAFVSLREAYASVTFAKESRSEAAILINEKKLTNVAIDSALQPQTQLTSIPGTVKLQTLVPTELVLQGFDGVISSQPLSAAYLDQLGTFGQNPVQRVVVDPKLFIYQINPRKFNPPTEMFAALPLLSVNKSTGECRSDNEPYCWTTTRLTVLDTPSNIEPGSKFEISLKTPWPEQEIQLLGTDVDWQPLVAGDFKTIQAKVVKLPLLLAVKTVKKPSDFLGSTDSRALGVAVASLRTLS